MKTRFALALLVALVLQLALIAGRPVRCTLVSETVQDRTRTCTYQCPSTRVQTVQPVTRLCPLTITADVP